VPLDSRRWPANVLAKCVASNASTVEELHHCCFSPGISPVNTPLSSTDFSQELANGPDLELEQELQELEPEPGPGPYADSHELWKKIKIMNAIYLFVISPVDKDDLPRSVICDTYNRAQPCQSTSFRSKSVCWALTSPQQE
jgi:hypothetical protein